MFPTLFSKIELSFLQLYNARVLFIYINIFDIFVEKESN